MIVIHHNTRDGELGYLNGETSLTINGARAKVHDYLSGRINNHWEYWEDETEYCDEENQISLIDTVTEESEFLDWLKERARIIVFPKYESPEQTISYPLEHSEAANKDEWDEIYNLFLHECSTS